LIHDDIVLTAGHCYKAWDYRATVGAYNVNDLSGTQQRGIVRRVFHPDYIKQDDPFLLQNDWLIVKLARPVTNVEPVSLNCEAANPANRDLVMAVGMGLEDKEEKIRSELLKKVEMPIVKPDV